MIWFLLVLTTGSFHLVLQELYDGRGKQNYLKAYAAAEAGLEEALFQIHQYWYGFYQNVQDNDTILWSSPKTASVSYDFEWKVQDYTWELGPSQFDILPLFWIDSLGVIYPLTWNLILSGASSDLVWNIVSRDVWVSGVGDFDSSTKLVSKKELESTWNFSLMSDSLDAFLSTPGEKYILLQNTSSIDQSYTLKHTSSEYFTLPRESIVTQGKIGKYTQNIKTELDNTEFLWLLRYSIYSWE